MQSLSLHDPVVITNRPRLNTIEQIARNVHAFKELCEANKRKRSTIFLLTPPPITNASAVSYSKPTCTALTMSGSPCRNKAVCAGFCRTHAASASAIF